MKSHNADSNTTKWDELYIKDQRQKQEQYYSTVGKADKDPNDEVFACLKKEAELLDRIKKDKEMGIHKIVTRIDKLDYTDLQQYGPAGLAALRKTEATLRKYGQTREDWAQDSDNYQKYQTRFVYGKLHEVQKQLIHLTTSRQQELDAIHN